jgi:ParB-like chromosome segregation protein Spo0J
VITVKRAQDLRINVVDNHIIRDYMERIERGDQLYPVVIRGTRIVDGNHRAAAYKKLGLDIPTVDA